MYILFEGIDTCGKSTQIELLAQNIPELVITKEPGGTQFGVKAREILLSRYLVFQKSRAFTLFSRQGRTLPRRSSKRIKTKLLSLTEGSSLV